MKKSSSIFRSHPSTDTKWIQQVLFLPAGLEELTFQLISRMGKYETEVKLSDMLELAQLYENQTPTGTCFKQENIPQYFDLLVKEVADLKKSSSKG